MSLRVNFIKTLWGVKPEMGNEPNGYDKLFERIKREGFDGVETPISVIEDKKKFKSALDKHGLVYIAMINTCRFAPDHTSSKLEDHVVSFRRLVQEAKELAPIFINSHSGLDSWSFDVAKQYFTQALAIEEEEKIKIVHETHRGRILYNPWITRDLCREFPNLKLTADLSHFCCVAERVFDVKSGYDDDWPEILQIVADRAHHVHARVGYAEGPQVPHPAAAEYRSQLELHETWWDAILTRQAAKGATVMTVEPEHGTDGYQHAMPFSQIEVSDLWVVNNWIKDREMERMSRQPYWAKRPLVYSPNYPKTMGDQAQIELLPNVSSSAAAGEPEMKSAPAESVSSVSARPAATNALWFTLGLLAASIGFKVFTSTCGGARKSN